MAHSKGEPLVSNKVDNAAALSLYTTASSQMLSETPSSNEDRCYDMQRASKGLHRASPKPESPSWAQKSLQSIDPDTTEARKRDILFENVSVRGTGSALQIQQTVLSALAYPLTYPISRLVGICGSKRPHEGPTILHGFDGLVRNGELLLVLGRPGSGCSTFLKVLCGYLEGLDIDAGSDLQFKGVPFATMMKHYRGEVVYNQEADQHFPNLTVGQTLEFAAHARAPRNRMNNVSRKEYVKSAVQVVMETFGLSHTYSTKVGSDYVPGVSGGERKRVR